jgi:hypothetical protein
MVCSKEVFRVGGQRGVEFQRDLDFAKKLLYTDHPNGDLVCTDDSFFIECMEGRNLLNPSTWIENSAVPLQPTFESFAPEIQVFRVHEKMVQSAISTWRTSPLHP